MELVFKRKDNFANTDIFLGGNQSGDSANVSDVDDGQTHYHGPIAAGCRKYGGENHKSDRHLSAVSTKNGGICLPQGDSHGVAGR